MKKLISLIAIVALLVTALTIFASCGGTGGTSTPANTNFTKVEGSEIQWKFETVDGTSILKIHNTNNKVCEMPKFEKNADLPWEAYLDYVTKIELVYISNISDYAFLGMKKLTSVDFGKSVTKIGKASFAFCTSLKSIEIPSTVTEIGDSAFEACSALESIKLSDKITKIGEGVFAYDRALTEVSASDAVAAIIPKTTFTGIEKAPTIKKPELAENNSSTSTESGKATDATTDTATDESGKTETEVQKESDTTTTTKSENTPTNTVTVVISCIILVLVIAGLIVGGILLMRSNKNLTNDSRTVRKNSDDKKSSKGKKK